MNTFMSADASPLVSIVTPTWNHEGFIASCIDSVLQQDYSHWELIIIDDDSTDGTASVVARYSDPRIHYCHQPHKGIDALADTYNCAVSQAQGELIAVLEGDDLWASDNLVRLVPHFVDPAVVLAYGEIRDVDEAGNPQTGSNRTQRKRPKLAKTVLFNNPVGSATKTLLTPFGPSLIPPATVMLRRRTLESIGGFQSFPGLRTTDYPTYLRLSLEGKFHYESSVIGFHRRHVGSVTVSTTGTGHLHAARCAADFAEKFGFRVGLSTAERTEIQRAWTIRNNTIDFSQGRTLLVHRQWRSARQHFKSGAASGDFLVRLASIAGWAISFLHLDLEAVMQWAGRASLRVRRQNKRTVSRMNGESRNVKSGMPTDAEKFV